MSLQPPRLDDRSFADLRAELVRRIPMHAPQWTDHNAADPGIALLELFAALGDDLLYRFNRIPEAARLAFLQLLAIDPLPAQVAQAQLRLELPKGKTPPIRVPSGPGIPRLCLAAGDILFQAADEITVLPLQVQAWQKQRLSAQEQKALSARISGQDDMASLLEMHLQLPKDTFAKQGPDCYEAVSLPAPEGGIAPPPLDSGTAVDGALWLCLLAPEGVPDPGMIRPLLAGEVLNLGVRIDELLCGPTDHRRCPDPGSAAERWPLLWEISTGAFYGNSKRVDQARYLRLTIDADDSESFGRNGTVRLRLPAAAGDGSLPFGVWEASSFDPPQEDLLGLGPLPPRLEDPMQAKRVLAWIRVQRRDRSHPPLRVRWIDANVIDVVQAVTAEAELLGYGDARGAQEYRLAHGPVIPGSERVQVRGPLGWETWQAVEDLALAGPDDPFYRLDVGSGTVRFGDGVHGRIPLPGEAIRCLTYQYGGGVAGNVGGGRINRLRSGPVEALDLRCDNPLPAEGGTDAESQEKASARIPAVLRHGNRAVAIDDFVDLALQTPGAGIGRVHGLPRHQPHQRVDGVAGTVTLIVIPAYDPLHPQEPMPDREQLRRVCAYLEPRRLVTTELYVTPPTYVGLNCSVAVEAEPGTGEETLRTYVELALRQMLAPLPPFGPEGRGWPFGRDVTDRDLEAAVLRVQGVRLVNQVLLRGWALDAFGESSEVKERLPLRSWQLPSLRQVRVVAGETAEPVPDDGDGAPPQENPPLYPVPVVRGVC
jgi:hypothetical protein